jgi:hypothetical protein
MNQNKFTSTVHARQGVVRQSQLFFAGGFRAQFLPEARPMR